MATGEVALDPGLPIVDPHHHLWDLAAHLAHLHGHPLLEAVALTPRYLVPELLDDIAGGHRVVATVYMECGAHYHDHGPDELKPVGEVAYAGRVAEACAGSEGPQLCAGIVGFADFRLGEGIARALEAAVEAGGGRLRGVRYMAAHDADADVLGATGRVPAGVLQDPVFRRAYAQLRRFDLSFDAWVLEPQLADVVDLAQAFPDTPIIVDHTGSPVGLASYRGRLQERYADWAESIRRLAACPNVTIKLGGLGNPLSGLSDDAGLDSKALAESWRPYLWHAIECFGADRCLFESNFPVDRAAVDYVTLWNAFKRITAGATLTERHALFARTAARIYRIHHDLADPRSPA